MRNTKKLAGMMLATAVTVGTLACPQVNAQAQDFKVFNTLAVTNIQSADQYASSIKWNALTHENLGRAPQSSYYKFTLAQDSIVRFDFKKGSIASGYSTAGDFTIYSDSAMTKAVLTCSEGILKETTTTPDSTVFTMKKGTYYVQETISVYGSSADTTAKQESQFAITAIPKTSAFGIDYTIENGTLANLKMTSHLSDWAANGYYACWSKEYIPMMQDISKFSSKGTNIDVTKGLSLALDDGANSNYTIAIRGSLAYGNGVEGAWEIVNDSAVQPGATYTVKLDTVAPAVTGIKNGGTYVGKARVSFSDQSGIKSAKLNGKNIKSGKTVKRAGAYKLSVTDKHGNTRTIAFKVVAK